MILLSYVDKGEQGEGEETMHLPLQVTVSLPLGVVRGPTLTVACPAAGEVHQCQGPLLCGAQPLLQPDLRRLQQGAPMDDPGL